MIKPIPEHYYINRNTPEDKLPSATKFGCNFLRGKHGNSIRVSDFIILLKELYGKSEWELFDPNTWNSAEFLSYMIDQQIAFNEGKDIDAAQLHRDFLKVYEWTGKEKLLFRSEENIEEKIWSIFLCISDPEHENYIL